MIEYNKEHVNEAMVADFNELMERNAPPSYAKMGGYYKEAYNSILYCVVNTSLKRARGNQVAAARALGINRNTLRKFVRIYKLNVKAMVKER